MVRLHGARSFIINGNPEVGACGQQNNCPNPCNMTAKILFCFCFVVWVFPFPLPRDRFPSDFDVLVDCGGHLNQGRH